MTSCLWCVIHLCNNEILTNLCEVRPFIFYWQNEENSKFVSISGVQIKKIFERKKTNKTSTYVSFNILVLKSRVR